MSNKNSNGVKVARCIFYGILDTHSFFVYNNIALRVISYKSVNARLRADTGVVPVSFF